MKKENLYIVIPAYNEEETIETVVSDWHKVVKKIGNGSKLLIIDDGSCDHTYEILKKLEKEYPYLKAVTKKNSGHGPTLHYGYTLALKEDASYIFQTDSDGQTNAAEFWEFWERREEYDVIIGKRKKREDGFSRIIVTNILKYILKLIFGVYVEDANTPFRLMHKDVLKKYIKRIPKDYNLSNVMLSVYFVFYKEKILFLPISFAPRQGGKNSINLKKIFKIGVKALEDFMYFKNNMIEEDLVLKKKQKKKKSMLLFLFCFFLSFIGITVCSKNSFLYPIQDGNDMNAYFTVGKALMNGYVPYKDLFDQKGPILYVIYAISYMIHHTSFIGVYFLEILFFTVFLYFISKTILLFSNNHHYICIIIPIFSSFLLSSEYFFHGGSAEEFTLPFISYALYSIMKYFKIKEIKPSILFLNGIMAGMIAMIKYNLLGFHLAMMLILIIDIIRYNKGKNLIKTCFFFLLGMMIPILGCVIYFSINHALKDFIQVYLLFNIVGYKVSFLGNIKRIIIQDIIIEHFTLYPIYLSIFLYGIIYFIFHKTQLKGLYKLAIPFLLLLTCLGIYIGGRGYYYYHLILVPFYFLGFLAILLTVEEYYEKIKIHILYLCIFFSFSVFFFQIKNSPNLSFMTHGKSSLSQYTFASIIKRERDQSFLNYDSLDNGFYITTDQIPKFRYYMKLNVVDEVFPDIMIEQNNIIENAKTNFIIVKYEEKDKKYQKKLQMIQKNYFVIKKQKQFYEDRLYTYALYKRKNI